MPKFQGQGPERSGAVTNRSQQAAPLLRRQRLGGLVGAARGLSPQADFVNFWLRRSERAARLEAHGTTARKGVEINF